MNAPDRVWDFGILCACETGNITSNRSIYSHVTTPLEVIDGEIPDITYYFYLYFYDWVVYKYSTVFDPK